MASVLSGVSCRNTSTICPATTALGEATEITRVPRIAVLKMGVSISDLKLPSKRTKPPDHEYSEVGLPLVVMPRFGSIASNGFGKYSVVNPWPAPRSTTPDRFTRSTPVMM
ncbi:MAG: hypothetical protein Q8P67_09150 [archaeon]|nr:hypothetical protein [archaeon]